MGSRKEIALESYNKRIGEKVRKLRKEKEINQQDFAEMMGYTKSHMCALENGRKSFTAECLFSLSQHLDCSIDMLISDVPASYTQKSESDAHMILMDEVKEESYDTICKVIRLAWCKDHPNEDVEKRLQEIKEERQRVL